MPISPFAFSTRRLAHTLRLKPLAIAVGLAAAWSCSQAATAVSHWTLTDLGTLGGSSSYGTAINAAGQVTGYAFTPYVAGSSNYHAFLYSNGVMTDLGTLGGIFSEGYGINAAGQVAGSSYIAGNADTHAVLYSSGTKTDLGTLGGTYSGSTGINAAGQVTEYAYTIGNAAQHAFLYSNGTMLDLNTFNGVTGSGVTLTTATAINDAGQIVANSASHGYLLTLDTTVWEGGSSGSFASGSGWSAGVAPNRNTVVFIDPTVSATIYGPTANTDVKRLTVGGDGTGNNGIATLSLNGGTINVLGSAGQFTSITAKGVLTGDGTVNGAVLNQGTVNAVNLSLTGGLTNSGIVTGNGRLNTNLSNAAAGTVQLGSGQRLMLSGTAHDNAGLFDLTGGGQLQVSGSFTNDASGQVSVAASTARFDGAVTNSAGGRFQFNDATVRFNGGLSNSGQVQVTFGESSVFGAITTGTGGKVILSGNSNTTFYDALDIQNGGELRTSAGSTAVFFGLVSQRTGSLFTGTGTKFYEGGLHVGASPGFGVDSGDVNLGSANVFSLDIGGTTACTALCATDDAVKNSSYGHYVVNGHLGLGGTLKLDSWLGFVAQAGESFSLLSWGSVGGSFDTIDASGLLLAQGTALDTTRLTIDGSISVVAVPEPAVWALMLGGLAACAGRARWLRHHRDGAMEAA